MPPSNPSARVASLHALLASRIAVLDGAMGTMVHALGLGEPAPEVAMLPEVARDSSERERDAILRVFKQVLSLLFFKTNVSLHCVKTC
jgi:methionine synthase I (cobalamin-dependent)